MGGGRRGVGGGWERRREVGGEREEEWEERGMGEGIWEKREDTLSASTLKPAETM